MSGLGAAPGDLMIKKEGLEKKNVSTEIRPDLVTTLSRGGDGRLSLGVDQLQAKTPPAVQLRQKPSACCLRAQQGGVRGSWAKFFRKRRATVVGLGVGRGQLGVFVCYYSRWSSACLRVNTQFRLALCGSCEGISEDMALL